MQYTTKIKDTPFGTRETSLSGFAYMVLRVFVRGKPLATERRVWVNVRDYDKQCTTWPTKRDDRYHLGMGMGSDGSGLVVGGARPVRTLHPHVCSRGN